MVSSKALPSEVESRVEKEKPALVFVAVLPPGGLEQARYLCKRFRKLAPHLPIIVGYWGGVGRKYNKLLVRLRSVGASYLTTSLLQSRDLILSLLCPVRPASPDPNPTAQAEGGR